ncbi:MAG TPA: peptidoglycan-binding domain-containing protein [Thermoleophilaceae bacterium]|jgi:peptidoglycan hydrolase-like protein with peptidoglycan-binding domain
MLLREPEAPAAPVALRRRWPAAAVVLALAAAGWFGWEALRAEPDHDARRDPAKTATARLERRTLVERETVDGELGYAGTRTLVNRLAEDGGRDGGSGSGGSGSGGGPKAGGSGSGGPKAGGSGSGSGTVTWLPASGTVIRPGGVLYRIDDRPVVLMDGSVPAYRSMEEGVARGADVRQLERNLVALGFGAGVTVDDRFTGATATAVKRWQRSLGVKRTGAVELGRVVFLAGVRRVGDRKAAVGTALTDGTEVLATTSTRRVVEVELEVAKQSLVRPGDGVRVTLPDGSEVAGRIASVGRAARAKSDGDGSGSDPGGSDGSGSGEQELVVDVSISLRSTRGARRLDRAPVSVDIARRVERDVLAAPVTALLARSGGGYAVELVDRAGRRRVVPVRTGFFADGYVEVAGRGIRPGTRVAVPE